MRYAWIEQHRDDYAVSRMCRLLTVSRTGYLQWRWRPPSVRAQANARLDAQVAALHASSQGSYGRPRIVRGLREQGLQVGSERVRRSLQRQALQAAYSRRKPPPGLIMHSDRGSQYVSDRYRKLIADFRMLQSMSRRANCWDNAPMESFFKTLKVERVYQLRYETRAQARLDIVDWIEGLYNHRRLHSSIGYRIPAHVESKLMAA